MKHSTLSLLVLSLLAASLATAAEPAAVPTCQQLAWQRHEFIAFAHFGINTFTDREWGEGNEDPKLFNPTEFDAHQWAATLKEAGARLLILTAKHHDGFCLWPSKYTEHCVRNSPWRGGQGDVVREVVDAMHEKGIRVGLYLSPWDRNQPCYGDSPKYNEYFRNQLRELLSNYGDIDEVWFDGACGEGPNGKRQEYDWPSFYAVVRELQSNALIAISGPDIRWVGNESGVARENESSVVPRDGRPIWHPAECDVSIRPGWFYHASEDARVKSLSELAEIYFKSVGRNSVLLLNVPPDRRGRIAEADVARLREFRGFVDRLYATDFVRDAKAAATTCRDDAPESRVQDGDLDTYWSPVGDQTTGEIEFDLGQPRTFNVARIQEHLPLGERVEAYRVEVLDGEAWRPVATGRVIGHKQLCRFPAVTAQRVRLVVEKAAAPPAIAEFGLHVNPLDAPVKVMTFNIRYLNPDDGPNQWQFRKEMVTGAIGEFGPDFLCLQEATPEQLVYLREKLSAYGCLNRTRETDPKLGESCAVFYRKDRWAMDPERQGTFWLSETPEVPGSRSWKTECVRIATWARFTEQGSGRAFWVYNTHLDHVSEQARIEGAKLVARRIADRGSDEPVALTGDFNAGEASQPVRYLTGQGAEPPAKLVDTFRAANPGVKEVGTFNGFRGKKDGDKIDYILVLPGTKVTAAAIDRRDHEGRYPSDHFPVTAEILLPEK